jgi:hypothetical protein
MMASRTPHTSEADFTMPKNIPMRPFKFTVALDNHEPFPRNQGFGEGEMYDTETVTNGVQIHDPHIEMFKDALKSIYLVDDGRTVTPYYVAGWSLDVGKGKVILHPFPCNPNGETRPDNGRVIDFTTWLHGPRRAYHLKVTFS